MKRWTITYNGKMFSANGVKRSGWRNAHNEYQRLKGVAAWLWKEAKPEYCQTFAIEVRFRALIDLDNMGATVKPFIDALTDMKVITDDKRDYWKRYQVEPDLTMKHNTLEITLIQLE